MSLMQYLHHVDKDLSLAINSLHTGFTDSVWMLFSNTEIWYILYIVVAVFFFKRLGWKKAVAAVLACALCCVLCDQTANLFKDTVCRLRPCHDADMIARGLHILEDGGPFGFYSSHAANTFGFAVCSTVFFKWDKTRSYRPYKSMIFTWAALVSLSRVFVGKHFFGDVLVGTAAGLLTGWLISKLATYIVTKYNL